MNFKFFFIKEGQTRAEIYIAPCEHDRCCIIPAGDKFPSIMHACTPSSYSGIWMPECTSGPGNAQAEILSVWENQMEI